MKITAHAMIDALDSVTWYNGLAEHIRKWKDYDKHDSHYFTPYAMYLRGEIDKADYNQIQVIWMICVNLFGDYGTSPRSGWINDLDDFYDFIDKITSIYTESEEMEVAK